MLAAAYAVTLHAQQVGDRFTHWDDQYEITAINTENEDNTWTTSTERIPFPTLDGKIWEDYVTDTRLEVSCGEAPYLVSRYGVVSGIDIDIKDRIGILDRKLRIIFSYERSN